MNLRPKFYNGWLMLFLMIWVASCFSQELPLTANALPAPTSFSTERPVVSTELLYTINANAQIVMSTNLTYTPKTNTWISSFPALPPLPPEVSPTDIRAREQQRGGRRTVARPEASLPTAPVTVVQPVPVNPIQPAQQRILDQLENNRRRALPVVTFNRVALPPAKPKTIRSPRDAATR